MNYETYQHIECQVKTHIYLLRLMFLIFYNCTKYHTLTCNYVTRLVSGGDVLSTGDKCPLTAWSCTGTGHCWRAPLPGAAT